MTRMATVAFLDILGFRNRIEREPLQQLAEQYTRAIGTARSLLLKRDVNSMMPSLFPNHPAGQRWCNQATFSDLMILISDGDDESACLKLLVYAWKLMQVFVSIKMPLRGGIAFGEMHSDEERDIYLGKALTVAYSLESDQDWIGIAIDDSVTAAFPSIFLDPTSADLTGNVIFMRHQVPLKNNRSRRLNTVNWRFNFIAQRGTRSLFPKTGDESIDRKIDHTLEYARATVSTGAHYFSKPETVPPELRAMWCGGTRPPFDHGDEL